LQLTRKEVRDEVFRIIRETLQIDAIPPEAVAASERSMELLGANSIDALEMILSVEDRFAIQFEDEHLRPELVDSLERFVDEIWRRTGSSA
jgi:acyl carrier protein